MKRITILFSALILSFGLSAQSAEEILSTVEKNAARTFNGSFTEVRISASGDSKTLKGDLLYKPETYLSMMYSNEELFSIDGQKMVMIRDGSNQIFDLTKNVMMKSLASMLLNSFGGHPKAIAESQGADLSACVEGNFYKVNLTARKKSVRGYSSIELLYDRATCSLRRMKLCEFSGAETHYSMDK